MIVILVVMIVFPICMVVVVIMFTVVGMRMVVAIVFAFPMLVIMIVVSIGVVMMVIMFAGIPVRMFMCAEPDRFVPVQKIEGSEEKHSNSGDQSIDPERRIKVAINSTGGIKVKKEPSPSQESRDSQKCEDLFHEEVRWSEVTYRRIQR